MNVKIPALLMAALLSTAAGCGPATATNFVKSVQVKSLQQDGDAIAEVDTVIDAGNIQLPSFDIPIVDPRNPTIHYGDIKSVWRLDQTNELDIQVDLTEIARLPGGGAKLPNGADLPVGGLDPSKVISIPVGNTGADLYVAVDTGAQPLLVIGTAIPFKQFGGIGGVIGNANLFLGFTFPQSIRGIAGIFTSTDPTKNGMAIFVDASAALATLLHPQPTMTTLSAKSAGSPRLSGSGSSPSHVTFADVKPSSSRQSRIQSELYRLHRQNTRLSLP